LGNAHRSRRYTRGNPNRRQTCRAFGWTGMRWTCGKRRLAVGENGFISRNPLRSCGGLNCGTRERDATTPSSYKLFAPPRNLLRPCMVDSACLLDSHAPRDQASPQFPTPGLSPPFTISLLLGRVYILGTRTDNIAPVLTVRDLDSVESVPTRPVSSGMSFSPVEYVQS
jgi:hypothetical protein